MGGAWYRLRKTSRSPRVILSSLTVATTSPSFAGVGVGFGAGAAMPDGGAGGWARTNVGRTNPAAIRKRRPDRIDALMGRRLLRGTTGSSTRNGRGAARPPIEGLYGFRRSPPRESGPFFATGPIPGR